MHGLKHHSVCCYCSHPVFDGLGLPISDTHRIQHAVTVYTGMTKNDRRQSIAEGEWRAAWTLPTSAFLGGIRDAARLVYSFSHTSPLAESDLRTLIKGDVRGYASWYLLPDSKDQVRSCCLIPHRTSLKQDSCVNDRTRVNDATCHLRLFRMGEGVLQVIIFFSATGCST
jgi:hypothetical protein